MEGQFNAVIRQKIIDSLAAAPRQVTRRDLWIPNIPGKAVAVIGMRRAGKTSLLWQLLGERLQSAATTDALNPRDGLLYFSFEDERLAGMSDRDGWWSRDRMVARYAERTGFDLTALPWHEVLGIFKLAVIIQQIYARYEKGQTADPRFREMGRMVEALAAAAARKLP